MADTPFNPLDKRHLGESVASALLSREVVPLPPGTRFIGAGIYAIYYTGDFPLYAQIADRNRNSQFTLPIYVGKAVPPGARKGGFGLGQDPGTALYNRLREHARSIGQIGTLRVEDFYCRYLISDDIWIPLGEQLTIAKLRPAWNLVLDGFGNHPPGGGRRRQARSRWDTVHPGRPWARELPDRPETADELAQALTDFLAGRRAPLLTPEEAVTKEEEPEEEQEQ